jgi:CheY-like chemotaxis protein/anti-sigma regulatory factor (Ser/Thr protein kinase)
VLINLLSNAVKYNRRDGEITVRYGESPDGRVELAVADTGKGLTAEQLRRIFEPFDRLDETEIEGTGLGLALSLRLMEAMGGTIRAESQPGIGTTMRMLLERRPEVATHPQETPAGGASSPQCTLVYIEDNLSNLKLVERLVERVPGVRLIPAMQGRVGLELVRQHLPDLVLLDLHLPDLNGREALALLKGDPATAGIPVVILSADATPGEVERLKDAGALEYLTKPIDVDLLLQLMLRTVRGSASAHDARVLASSYHS